MKKLLSVWLIVLAMVLFIGCGDKLSIKLEDAEKSITLTVGEEHIISLEKTGKGTLVYESSDSSVAEASQGVITGKAKGTAVVTISFKEDESINVKINVTVKEESTEIKVSQVAITGAKEMLVDDELQLTATVTPDNATNKNVEWKSSDETLATVADGKVKALSAGTVTITCTAKDGSNAKAEVEIKISEKSSEELLEKPALVGLFNEYALNANVFELVEGKYVLTLNLEESVETELLVATAQKDGKASGLYDFEGAEALAEAGKKLYDAGTYVLTYDAETHKTTVEFTPAEVAVEDIYVSINGTEYDETKTIELVEQDKLTLEIVYVPTDKPVSKGHSFSVSDPLVATITEDGELEVLAAGEFNIIVFVTSAEREFTFKVNAKEKHFVPETIEVVKKSPKVEVGGQAQMSAKVSPERASQEVTWSVSDTTVATIDENGVVTGVKVGKVKVIATSKEVATVVGEVEFEVVAEITVDLNTVLVSPEFTSAYEEVSYDGKTFIVGKNAFTTWADAYEKVNEKGTVILKAGEYSLEDVLTKSVTIKGEAAESVIIQVKQNVEKNLQADEIAFEKVTLKGNGGGAGVTGVYFEASENTRLISVKNCIVTEMNTFLKIAKTSANDIEITIEDSEIGVIGQFIAWLASGMKEFTFTGNTVNAGESGGVTNAAGSLIRTRSGKSYIYNNVFTGTTLDNDGLFESGDAAEFVNVMYNVFKDCQKVLHINGGSEKPIYFDNNLYLDADGNVLSAVPEVITGEGVSAGNALASEEERAAKYAEFKNNVLSITYNLNGGVNPEGAPVQFNKGQAVELPNPTKEGFVFKGWFLNAEFTGDALVSTPIDANEGIVLYAKFVQEIKSNIVADLDGGTCENMPTTYVEGVGVELPTPTREGYEFKGWSTVKGGTEYINAISKETTGEVKLYANWNNLAPKEMKVGANEEYTTLDDAIKAANDGDKILVGEGEFTLGVAINSSVIIKGAGSSKTIINVTKDVAKNLNGKEITIDSVTLKGADLDGAGGVYFQPGDKLEKLTVSNSVFTTMKTIFRMDNANISANILIKDNKFEYISQFIVWATDGLNQLTFAGNEVDATTFSKVDNKNAALLRIRVGSALVENNTFIGDPVELAAYFECGVNGVSVNVNNNVFKNVTKFVYINGGNPVVFGENTYLDSEGNALSTVPETVTGKGVTPGTAKGYYINIDLSAEDNTTITVTGIVQEVISKGFIIRDGNVGVQVTSTETVAAGDVVKVTGTKSTNKEVAVIAATSVVIAKSGLETEAAVEMTTAEYVALQNTQENVGKKIILVGTIVVSGDYVNFKLDSKNTAYLTLDSTEVKEFKKYKDSIVKLTVYPLYKSGIYPHQAAARLSSLVDLTLKVGAEETYKTLDDAVKAAADGSTIVLGEGEFTLGVAINKSVTIKGEGSSKTIINVTKDVAKNLNGKEITIDAVTLKGADLDGAGGVYFQPGDKLEKLTVSNSVFTTMKTIFRMDNANISANILIKDNKFEYISQFIVWATDGLNQLTFTGNEVDATTFSKVDNKNAALLRIRVGSALVENNTFIGDPAQLAAYFECGANGVSVNVNNNVFKNVTKFVYINGGNPVVFGANKYLDAEGNQLSAVPETVTGKGVTPGTAIVSLELDFSTKSAKNGNYGNTWQYGDFTISGGANNNGGWDYVKIGGKKATLESYPNCYIKSDVATTFAAKKVTVYTNAGNLSKAGKVKSWTLKVYSDAECTQEVASIAGEEMTKGTAQELVFNAESSWQAGCYFKIVFELENTNENTNGIVWINKVVIE